MSKTTLRWLTTVAAALLLVILLGRLFIVFFTEALWYEELGYGSVFWTRVWVEAMVRGGTTLLAAAIVFWNLWVVARRLGPVQVRRRYGNLEIAEQIPRRVVNTGVLVTAGLTGLWLSDVKFGGDSALSLLTMARRVSWGLTDPLFGNDVSYYAFVVPVLFQFIDFLLLTAFWSVMLAVIGYTLVGSLSFRENRLHFEDTPRLHLTLLLAALVALTGVRYWFARYGILFDGSGFNDALGYTDVHARLPGQRIIAVLWLLAAVALVVGARRRSWLPPAAAAVVVVAGTILLGYLYPSIIQKLRVEPNQLGRESPYIQWNMDFTRTGFGIHRLERRQYTYRGDRGLTVEMEKLRGLPLWDAAPLLTAYNQVQALFGYYTFHDVDFDRYGDGPARQQVAIGVREFQAQGLREAARTWQTLHLNAPRVRGMGAVVAPAGEVESSEPEWWLSNLDPIQRSPEAPPGIMLTEPSVLFGEDRDEYLILGTEADSGRSVFEAADSVATGIPVSSFLRVLAFAWRFADRNLLFSGQLTDDSRLVYRRNVGERLRALAPFVLWDSDPYAVIDRGRLVYMVDGYSATADFPLARPLRINAGGAGIRYLRNSVKAVVDAADGSVRIYAADPAEPFLQTYARAFPGLIRPISELSPALVDHLKYPEFYLRAQADVLEEYHLTTPESFFAQQDVWQLPVERGGPPGAPFLPLYTTMSLTEDSPPEFLLVAPFIANQRQNMTALLIARNDPPHYGELIVLELPRDQQIPGPTQVEAIIEADPTLSPQLTLWRQAGSKVELGQVRIVPIDSAFIYVVPVFLAAAGSPIPELERVIVSDGSRSFMMPTLQDAVRAFNSGAPAPVEAPSDREAGTPVNATAQWPARALELLRAAERSLQSGDYAGYGQRLNELRALLERLASGGSNQP